ncbi:MAG TPA: hypothetical protein VGN72_09170 [Tepidisphaeraceae bacterium]|nr:hypothetical protein [Tepidisphaeraceae bacterium]
MIRQPLLPARVSAARECAPPMWVDSWVGLAESTVQSTAPVQLTIRTGRDATLITARVVDARAAVDADMFRSRVVSAYDVIRCAIAAGPHAHVVRMWNHVPGIGDPMGDAVDRYMTFNAGRHAAMTRWFGPSLASLAPAASGVGHDGDDLVIHALATHEPGRPIENANQVPAYRYSTRYGPLPPCFARATLTRAPRQALLISGTAAITGEQTRHAGVLRRQFELTLDHLRTLLKSVPANGVARSDADDVLSRLAQVRIYVPRAEDRSQIAEWSRETFSDDVQVWHADLCRPDLLVEIEGYAPIEGSTEL